MAKRPKRQTNKKQKRGVQQAPLQPSILRRIGQRSWQLIVALSVVVGLIAAVYTFSPSVSVSTSSLLDIEHPFSNLFKVSNNSWLTITSVRYSCKLERVETSVYVDYVWPVVRDPGDDVPQMAPNETHDVRCPFSVVITKYAKTPDKSLVPMRIKTANVIFIISFDYRLWPRRLNRYFCFETRPTSQQDKLDWKSKPCSPEFLADAR